MSKTLKSLETFKCSYNHKSFPKTSQLLAVFKAGHNHPCLSLYSKKVQTKAIKGAPSSWDFSSDNIKYLEQWCSFCYIEPGAQSS